jgi:hypothetical protein
MSRNPSGWLVDQSTWKNGLTQIAPYSSYAGDKQKAGWLLDENIAFVYRSSRRTTATPALISSSILASPLCSKIGSAIPSSRSR